jgi:hypothetical protein
MVVLKVNGIFRADLIPSITLRLVRSAKARAEGTQRNRFRPGAPAPRPPPPLRFLFGPAERSCFGVLRAISARVAPQNSNK